MLNIKARIRALPYNSPGILPKQLPTPAIVNAVVFPPNEAPRTASEGTWNALYGCINPIPKNVVDGLNSTLKTIDKLIKVITPVLGLIEYFITTFNSMSSVLSAIIKMSKIVLNKWASDLQSTGVYINVLIPPAYLQNLQNNLDFTKLGNGGYQAFIDRLSISMYNDQDPNRPVFSDMGEVGGFIFMVDVDTMDEFFAGVKTFQRLFDLKKLLSLSADYPAPVNVKAEYGLWPYKIGASSSVQNKFKEITGVKADVQSKKLGVKLSWDPPPLQPISYRISRSQISGGIATVREIPLEDMNLLDAIKVIMEKIFQGRKIGPTEIYQAYDDKKFNKGKPQIVAANIVSGGGEYYDFDMVLGSDDKPVRNLYYYIIEGGSPLFNQWGRRSPEARAKVQPCVDPNTVKAIDNGNGNFEHATTGFQGLGMWSSIKPFQMIPLIPQVVNVLNKLLDSLAGATKNASKAFGDFIKGLKEKIEYFLTILEGVSDLIKLAVSLNSNYARLATLNVTPQKGGTAKFLERVQGSQPPSGTKFSGSTGITMGIVMVYGTPGGLTLADETAFMVINQSLSKVFTLMGSIFGGPDLRPQEIKDKVAQMNAATVELIKKKEETSTK